MDLQVSAYTAIYAGVSLVALTVAAFVWQRRSAPGGRWLLLLMIASAQWTLSDALDLSSTTLEGHIFWAKWSYVGATSAAVFLLLFALEYTDHAHHVTPTLITGLFIIPFAVTIATAFNELHGLTWTSFTPAPQDPSIIVYGHGPLYWFVTLYLTAVLFTATTMLVRFAIRNKDLYATQSAAIVVASLIPWVAIMVYNLFPYLLPGLDPSVMVVVTGAILAVSMFRYGLLDLAPIARATLVESMSDGVIVLDSSGCIADLNPAGRALLGADVVIGRTFTEVAQDRWPDAAEQIDCDRGEPRFVSESTDGRSAEFLVAPVRDAVGRHGGCVITMADVTQRIATERALYRANKTLAARLVEIERLHADLSEQVIRDPLTGLYNRRYLDETINRELARAERERAPLSIVMLDIDHFKQVNDDSGHVAGDLMLKLLASQLIAQTRPGDIACRYGGDEFLLVLTNTTSQVAMARADEWRSRFSTASVGLTGREPATISLGVAAYPTDGTGSDDLVAAADRAVYVAKAAGRDRVCHASALPLEAAN